MLAIINLPQIVKRQVNNFALQENSSNLDLDNVVAKIKLPSITENQTRQINFQASNFAARSRDGFTNRQRLFFLLSLSLFIIHLQYLTER
jgi:hypothetical protein